LIFYASFLIFDSCSISADEFISPFPNDHGDGHNGQMSPSYGIPENALELVVLKVDYKWVEERTHGRN